MTEAATAAEGWVDFARAAGEDARRFEVFALLRHLEARAPGRDRIGRSRLPLHDVVELCQSPSLGFAGATLDTIEVVRDRARVRGYYLGLTGPMGPLPLHLTEFAFEEERDAASRPFGRFLDLIAGRMLQFFYRAWADSQPAVHVDRPQNDRFADYVGALSGAREGSDDTSAFPARVRLHYAALFAGRRSVGAIEDGLRSLLGNEVTVHPFQPRWRAIDEADRSRLGRGFAALGVDAVAGGKVRQVSDAFRVTIRTESMNEYRALLPTGSRYALVAEALDAFAPSHLEWQIELELPTAAASPARLAGGAALGWTGWLGKSAAPAGADTPAFRADARLNRRIRKRQTIDGGISS